MKILLIGKTGQLGSALNEMLQGKEELITLSRDMLDITIRDMVFDVINTIKPDVVINAAAYNFVDRAEADKDEAIAVNATAPTYIAEACNERGSFFVHFSTDYVFDGEKRMPYIESDPPNPINAYGFSKWMGELGIMKKMQSDGYLIIRTSSVFGFSESSQNKGNFVTTMLELGKKRKPLNIVNDQKMSPTYARDLAEATIKLLNNNATQIIHITNRGSCSWYEFAEAIFRNTGIEIRLNKFSLNEYKTKAKRPLYSVMESERLNSFGIKPLRRWEEGLADFIERIKNGKS